MKTIYLLLFVLFFLPSCSNIQFIANENVLLNPLYEKTNVTITGDKVPFVNSIMLSKFHIPTDERSGIVFVFILVAFEWTMKKNERNPLNYKFKYFRRLVYVFVSYLIFAHFELVNLSQFIYFQF